MTSLCFTDDWMAEHLKQQAERLYQASRIVTDQTSLRARVAQLSRMQADKLEQATYAK